MSKSNLMDMNICKYMLLVFLSSFALTANSVHPPNDQSGFISIDCGSPGNTNYIDAKTGIFYTSDSGFINTGSNESVSSTHITDFVSKQFLTVRSFPEGTRNCYTLRPDQGKDHKYLIRASFMYGNYNGKNETPSFDIYLGGDYWDTINLTSSSIQERKEIIHIPSSDYIHVCLMKTGNYTPFISVLEVRLLNQSMYDLPDKSLQLIERLNFGDMFDFQYVRYNDDIFDRIWEPYYIGNSTSINSALTVDTSNDNTFTQPPKKIMISADQSQDVNKNLAISWNPSRFRNSTDKFYMFMYFAELEKLQSNQSREFNIYINGGLWRGPVAPKYLNTTTIFNNIAMEGLETNNLTISATAKSTLPPIINALEIYMPIDFSENRTKDTDVAAILDIKSRYKLTRNWQGDPCVPQSYIWDGLSCSYNDTKQARIISLNLASSKLKGVIAPSISNLTSLQTLDLSNNDLTGEVPEFLAELPFLKELYLNLNSFTDSIPEQLLKKSKNGTLLLSIDGQDEDTNDGDEVFNGKNKMVVPLVHSVVASLALLFVLVVGL